MKKYIYLSIYTLCLLAAGNNLLAQGCVAVRNMTSTCTMPFDSTMNISAWQFSLNYRFFRSFRHFRGSHEEAERVTQHTEVINHDHSVILGASYFHNRWSVAATIPFLYIDRSSLYEHDQTNRYHTKSKGLGDVRITGYYSVIPHNYKGHLTFGLGFKLPTGNYNYKDYFHRPSGLELRTVDQSIQPGDGGLGIITEVDLSKNIFTQGYVYLNGIYMLNPRETNGTSTNRSSSYESVMSVADQYFVRAGVNYNFITGLQVALGGRLEGIPVHDLIGGSNGFRRPGYIISAEPSVYYAAGKHSVGVNIPIALARNRTQSVPDIQRTQETGEYRHGDAAFADWLLSVTYAYRL